jgi:hypothetical protein
MKYEAPYGTSDPNSSYINGNPSTGTMGSIPPAASIENPQREIVNFITKSNLAPTDADLYQLAKAVQAGLVNYGLDVGTTNRIAITPVVPIAAYAVGQRFIIKMSYANTSSVQVNINGLGFVPVVHFDGSPILAGELIANQLIEIAFDSANFVMIAGGGPGGVVTLTAPRSFYLNATTGDDNLYDGTSPTISGSTGPFKTLQKALAQLQKYNLGGWAFGINFADGVYTTTGIQGFPAPNGSGTVYLQGNSSNPSAVSIFNTGTGSCWYIASGGNWNIDGFSFRATASAPGDAGNGIWVAGAANVTLGACVWNAVPGYHLCAGPLGSLSVNGPQTIAGSAGTHQYAFANGTLYNASPNNPNLTISGAVTIGTFVVTYDGAQTRPQWAAISGAANVTGSKYSAYGNGVIETAGRGTSYLPGTTAGTTATGGQYL